MGSVVITVLLVSAARTTAQCEIKKVAASGGSDYDWFGIVVAADQDVIVVSASGASNETPEPRNVYVYELVDGLWTETAALFADDGLAGNRFGADVSVSGDTLLIGDNQTPTQGPGAAYLFYRIGGEWTRGPVLDGVIHSNFGNTVAVSGATAVVGASSQNVVGAFSGSAYVFERNGDAWFPVGTLTPEDGGAYHQFGSSVAVNGNVLVVGAFRGEGNEPETGAAYLYEKISGEWTFVKKLTADDGAAGDKFGHKVAVSGQAVVAGAGSHDERANEAGAAYVFEKIEGVWRQTDELLADDGDPVDLFGTEVAISGHVIVVGSHQDDDTSANAGAVYVFEKAGKRWEQVAKLHANDGAPADFLGRSVAVAGSTIAAGANGDDDLGTSAGSAYVFTLDGLDCNGTGVCDVRETVGSGDADADGAVNLVDWQTFVACLGGPGAPPAPPISECVELCLSVFDLNGTGTVDLQDAAGWFVVAN